MSIEKYMREGAVGKIPVRESVQTIAGKTNATVSEPTETIPLRATVITKAGNVSKKPYGYSTTIMPAAVATPFPPLNEAKTVHMCPMTAADPAASAVNSWLNSEACIPLKTGRFAIQRTGKTPFKTSITITIIPVATPKTRIALVPPAFPEP